MGSWGKGGGKPEGRSLAGELVAQQRQPDQLYTSCPQIMKVRLQPPSGTELPAFNPIVHPSAITQVLLLANPQKEKVRLRYKLIFTMGDQTYNEMGDVDQFPPPETWGSL